jgi:hypothetical protein
MAGTIKPDAGLGVTLSRGSRWPRCCRRRRWRGRSGRCRRSRALPAASPRPAPAAPATTARRSTERSISRRARTGRTATSPRTLRRGGDLRPRRGHGGLAQKPGYGRLRLGERHAQAPDCSSSTCPPATGHAGGKAHTKPSPAQAAATAPARTPPSCRSSARASLPDPTAAYLRTPPPRSLTAPASVRAVEEDASSPAPNVKGPGANPEPAHRQTAARPIQQASRRAPEHARDGRAPSLPAARALAPAHAQEQRRARFQRLRAGLVRCRRLHCLGSDSERRFWHWRGRPAGSR